MKLIAVFSYLFMISVLMGVPSIAPKDTLFGVRTGFAFRSTPAAMRAIRRFRLYLLAALVCGLLAIALTSPAVGFTAPPLIGIAAFTWSFVSLNRSLKPFALPPEPTAHIDLTEPDRMPRTKWLSLFPVSILCGVALYLHQNWDRIPNPVPVHFGITGAPDRWAARSPRSVYGILILMGILLLWLILVNTSLWYGVRRSRTRRVCFNCIQMAELVIVLGPSYIAVSILSRLSPVVALGLIIGPVILLLGYVFRQASAVPTEPDFDPSPESAWTGGILYFNRNDPALAVPRRDGFGYTLNLAHVQSWLLFLGPVAAVVLGVRWLV